MTNHKYIFVIGGVMSGVGKGVTTSSLGKILSARGFRINPLKIDPYLNVDAGTMNPIEHETEIACAVALEDAVLDGEPMAIEEIARREVQQCGCICFYPA